MKRILLPLLALSLLLAPQAAAAEERASARVVNGQPAPEGSWPSQALIRSQGYMCGGTLIHPRWVVSAAHCFYGTGASSENTTVAIGSLNYFGAPEQAVSGVYSHSGFSENYDNDIALLRLKNASSYPTRAIARPEDYPYFSGDQPAFVAGWGTTCYQSCTPSRELRQATVTMRSWDMCSSIYKGSGYPFGPTMICAGGGPATADACQGDSGGPLEVDGPSGRILVGIVSWGIGCAMEEYPGVYTNVSKMNPWIGSYLIDKIAAPKSKTFGKATSIKITNQGSMSLPMSLKFKASKNFATVSSSCTNVAPGASCQVRVRDLKKGRNKGSLAIQSAAQIQLAKVKLVGSR